MMYEISDEKRKIIKDIVCEGIQNIKIHKIDSTNMIIDIDYDMIVNRICEELNE